jgi:hypothetical protein
LFIEVYLFLDYLFITTSNPNGMFDRRIYDRFKKREALEKKTELFLLSKYLNLEVKNAMLKFEIRNIIVTYLVYEKILGEYPLDF